MGVDPDDDAAAKVIAQRLSPQKQAWFDNLALRGAHEYAVELEDKNAELERENTVPREQLARVDEVGLRNAQLIDRIRARSKCADGYPLDEHINNITTQLAQVTQERDELRKCDACERKAIERACRLHGGRP